MKKKSKKTEFTEFLAAPASVANNATERKKALERKAREEARKEQIRRSKLKGKPTREDMLNDIVRVAEDQKHNNHHQSRSIGRPLYELYGHYPIEYIDREFGQFSHAKQQAKLIDEVGTALWRASRAKTSRAEHATRYYERYVKPYVVGAKESRAIHQPYLLLSISDTHAHFLDPFVWSAFLQAIRDLRPNGVLLNGDIIDGGEISRHPHIRGRTLKLKDELAFQREMFRTLRCVHDGDLFSTCGNHDLADRLPRYLSQVDPVVSELDDRRVDELMGLGKFGVKLFHGGGAKSPIGTEDHKPGFLLFGSYRIHHGTCLGSDPARSELRSAGRSGQSGHVHRASLAFGTTERDEGQSWMVTPMGARHEVGRDYIKGTNTGWQRGFGVSWHYPGGGVHQYPVTVQPGRAERLIVEGYTYERAKRCRDPHPSGNWLEGWKVA